MRRVFRSLGRQAAVLVLALALPLMPELGGIGIGRASGQQPGGNPASARPPAPSGAEVAGALQTSLIDAIASAEKSVVAIARVRKNADRALLDEGFPGAAPSPTDPNFIPNEYGTGVVVDRSGLILTAYHVLGNPEENDYYVWLNRVPYRAVKVESTRAADPWMDLAVLRIEAEDLEPIKLGDAESLKKGQFVVALGNPLAIARDGQVSATWGIVSNLSRKAPPLTAAESDASVGRETLHHYGTLIQTDAKLNLGTSGGALINLQGEMVGLLISLSAGPQYDSAAGFAIPVDEHFRRTLETLKTGRRADFGFLGVLPWSLTREERQQGLRGARIRDVVLGTPAARAKLRPGDIILSVNNHDVYDDNDLIRFVSAFPPETDVELTVQRGNALLTERVRLSKKGLNSRRPPYSTQAEPQWRGMSVEYATAMPAFYQQSRVIDPSGCVGVLEVQRDTPAWAAGLRPGDFVATVDGARIVRPDDFYQAVAARDGAVQLGVLTAGRVVERTVAAP